MNVMVHCEVCGVEISPQDCWIKVTGWIDSKAKPANRVVKDNSMPHGYRCRTHGWDSYSDQGVSLF